MISSIVRAVTTCIPITRLFWTVSSFFKWEFFL